MQNILIWGKKPIENENVDFINFKDILSMMCGIILPSLNQCGKRR